jgi:hypothetical protein
MKNILTILSLAFILTSCKSNAQKNKSLNEEKTKQSDVILYRNIDWISFEWKESVIGKDTLRYGAMEIITYIKGIDQKLGMQFDLGSANSAIYEIPLKEIIKDSLQYPFNVNWLEKENFADIDSYSISDLILSTKSYKFKNLAPKLLKDYGVIEQSNIPHIGTIGLDAVKDKFVIIDYQNKKIGITDILPERISEKVNFIDFEKTEIEQTIFKIKLDDEKFNVLFDTGSSSWTIITGESKFNESLGSSKIKLDSIEVSSWGKKDFFYKSPINKTISIAGKQFSNVKGYFFKDNEISSYLHNNDIIAIIGNRIFIDNNNTIIINFKNKQFGIVK